MEINKILWASDGSMESDMALKYVELLASKYGSEIVGLSVVQPVDIERLKVPVDIKKELFSIQALLEKKEYNRINKVLRMANAPVLAVRHKKGDKIDIKKILVPTDLSELTSISLDFAIDIANRFNSTIYLLHILELHHSYEISTSKIIEELRVLALKELQSYLNKIPKEKTKGINIQEMVTLYLRAWFGIVNFAEENGIDLIIMTTHGRKGLVRFMLGSTAEKVISESPCPVLTIKP